MRKFETYIDAPRGFMEQHRTTRINVNCSDGSKFGFVYNLENNECLQMYKNNEIVEKDKMVVLTDEECKELEHQILRNQGNHVDCSFLAENSKKNENENEYEV